MNTEKIVGNTSSSTPLSNGLGSGVSEEIQKVPPTPLFTFLLIIILIAVGLGGVLLGKFLYAPKPSPTAPIATPVPRADAPNSTQSPDVTANWKTYRNVLYGFETKYFPESIPQDPLVGTETTGQFTYLLEINFGTNPLKSQYGYDVKVTTQLSLDDYKGELIGHITDKIDSEEEHEVNGITWKKINYQIFLTTDYIPVTTAFTHHAEHTYLVTASALDIDQILSTFKFIDASEPTAPSSERNIQYAPPAGWKTHSSPMGFTFSYPPTYSSPAYEVVKRQLMATDQNSIFSYCQIDLGLGDTSGILIVSSYPGGSRRQHIMDLTALPFSSLAKISTQEAKLGNLSGLLVDFQDVHGSPPVPITDHTAIFVKNNKTALILHQAQVGSSADLWNDMLSSIKIDSNFSADLKNCR